MKTSICDGWEFTPEWTQPFAEWQTEAESVRLPHNPVELPLHYIDHEAYQLLCGYRRKLMLPEDIAGKRYFLQFDGAAHIATVYINGREAAHHRTGYTAFNFEITNYVNSGENAVTVKLDTTENPSVPPFGFVIDYLTYGGLYREAWLIETPASCIRDVNVVTPTVDSAEITVEADNFKGEYLYEIQTLNGEPVWQTRSKKTRVTSESLAVEPWNLVTPNRYRCIVSLLEGEERICSEEVLFGFRTAEFKADGFYLNGEKTFLRGLNRHQSYPYIGYAATESLQREDARILKEELSCTAVRTSHYPQSRYFIDECDRIGLLVFTEIPGWQHVGNDEWKEQACRNVEEMVLQYRNHPSIILWGVRINESQDDNKLYKRTNKIAHKLDRSRATSGVRYIEKSSLLEDVYAFNDFSHTGNNPGCKPRKKVTKHHRKAFLISEHNGHMFPTKAFDTWQRRQEHALRHIRVQNDALIDKGHAGCFGWCMFDYPTHKDFGSGDRICYHGVLDAFRNPKLAAAAYASQGDGKPVLEIGSSMDIGDYPGGQIGDVYVFSNAEEVELYKNDVFVTKLNRSKWNLLPHGPFIMDDTIGELLKTQEGFEDKKAEALRSCLLDIRKYSMEHLPFRSKMKLGWCMLRYKMRFKDGLELFGKYLGNWGGAATRWRFDAKVGEQIVKSVTISPVTGLHLEVTPGSASLREGDTYDMTSVRIRILDACGNIAPYAQLPLKLDLIGAAELVGPDTVTAEGGMAGTYIRTVGESGSAELTISADGLAPVTVAFQIA